MPEPRVPAACRGWIRTQASQSRRRTAQSRDTLATAVAGSPAPAIAPGEHSSVSVHHPRLRLAGRRCLRGRSSAARRLRAVAKEVGLGRSRPHGLRHSFVSPLIHEARSVFEVAAQAGHAPTMTLSTYAHVIAELEDAERVPAGTQILAARSCILRYRVRTLAPTARGARGDVPARTDTVGSRSFVVSAACPSAPASVPAAR